MSSDMMATSTSDPAAEDFAARAARLDADDQMAELRGLFSIEEGLIYLDGNSLGALPLAVQPRLADLVGREWGRDLITSWNVNDWWTLPGRVGDRIGRLIGAADGQVMCGDSTSVQLFQALVGACRLRPGRSLLLTDGDSFPTDQYLADSVASLLGLQVVRLHPSELSAQLSDQVAAVSFSQVDYRTGEQVDITAITRDVHAAGALMIWDLCHSAGAMQVLLDDAAVDFAVGCTYKYLNGGPGSPGFIYIAKRHQSSVHLPLTGWHGHQTPFDLSQRYTPAASIERARIGTPPIVSMTALDAALTVFDQADLAAIRAKSLALTDFAIDFTTSRLARHGVQVVTPLEHDRRGSQVSLRMDSAYEVCQALIERGVIGDFRAPDLLRLGFTPLYLSFQDVYRAMTELARVLDDGSYLDERYAVRAAVT